MNVEFLDLSIVFLAGMLAGVLTMLGVEIYNERMEDMEDDIFATKRGEDA